jgi:3-hydroxy-9,10-secoandrosta-1,3,5(10)-triene-9,17-dione monooxygenase reductase component
MTARPDTSIQECAPTGVAVTEASVFTQNHFRQVLGHYPTGVTVVTAVDDTGQPAGMAVGSFTSMSLKPPLVAFLPDKSSTSFPRIKAAESFCVNILSDVQHDLCHRFARSGGDKFTGLEWTKSPSGAPVLAGVAAWIDCSFDSVVDAGDHYLVVGRVLNLAHAVGSKPLLFVRGRLGTFNESITSAVR